MTAVEDPRVMRPNVFSLKNEILFGLLNLQSVLYNHWLPKIGNATSIIMNRELYHWVQRLVRLQSNLGVTLF